MKNILPIILLLCIAQSSIGQIKYQEFGQIFADDVMFVEDIGPLESLEEVKDSTKRALMRGFRNTNLKSIQSYLSPKLIIEIPEMDSILNSFEDKYNSVDSIFLFENSGYGVGLTGTIAITKFSHKVVGDLAIEYQYYCPGKSTVINRISINGKEFPSELTIVSRLKSKIREKDLSNREKYEAYKNLIELISPKEGQKYNDFYLPQSSNDLSKLNGSLSWYALNIGENDIAVSAATKGLNLNPSNKWINTNLALGLAQSDKLEQAINIYTELKDIPYRDKIYKDVFLADIEEVEGNGIEIKHKEKIIKALKVE